MRKRIIEYILIIIHNEISPMKIHLIVEMLLKKPIVSLHDAKSSFLVGMFWEGELQL
jgi:hypothetical protein